MTKPKKILRILGRTAVAVAVVATLAFVERIARTTPVTDVDVTVSGADGVHFGCTGRASDGAGPGHGRDRYAGR